MDKEHYNAAVHLLQYGFLPSGFFEGPQNSNKRNNFSRRIRKDFYLKQESNGIHLMSNSNRYVFCGAREEAKQFIKQEHERYNHLGGRRLYYLICQNYYTDGVRPLCNQVAKDCTICQKFNLPKFQ